MIRPIIAHSDVTSTVAISIPVRARATRNFSRSHRALLPVFLGLGALSQLQSAHAVPALKSTAPPVDSRVTRSVVAPLSLKATAPLAAPRILLAQVTPQVTQPTVHQPAAAPNERPRLEVPVGPATAPPDAAPGVPPPDKTVPVPVPVAPAPDVTPDVPPVIGNVAEAEGREISDVRVVGNRVIPAETILAQVRTQRGAAFSARQAELDRGRVDQLGFFATVQSQVAPDVADPTKIVVTFIVVENRVVSGYKFVNATNLKPIDMIPVLSSKIGVVLSRANVNADVAAIQKLYSDKGFAVLVQSAALDESGTLVFTLQEARVSRIELSGLKKTHPGLIRRQIRVKNGDPFDAAKLRRDLNRIYDLGFFEDVTFKVDDDANLPGSVIVTYLLKEKRTGQLSFGVGFDSRSKISGFASLQDNNLRGTGKRGLLSLETGSERNYEASYGDPFIGAKNASYDISIYSRTLYREPRLLEQQNVDTTNVYSFEEQRTGGRINFTMPLDYDRVRTLLFGYRNERAKLFQRDQNGNLTPPVTRDGQVLDDRGTVSAFSTGFLRDKRDSRLDPSRGSRQQFIVEKGVSFLGDTNFTKLDLDFRQYIPLMRGEKPQDQPKLVLAGRAVVGKSFSQLPAFEQYYIGGSDTVRGYDSDEQFGDNQYYANLELRYRFQSKIQLVGFMDAGHAYGGSISSPSTSTLYSFGAGVRLQTPIGPVRLDVGHGTNGTKTHFGIGPTF